MPSLFAIDMLLFAIRYLEHAIVAPLGVLCLICLVLLVLMLFNLFYALESRKRAKSS